MDMPSRSVSLLESVIGQNRAMQMLTNMVSHDTLHHALFFYGPRSVGKTTAALNLIKTLNCETLGVSRIANVQKPSSPATLNVLPALQFCNTCRTCQSINFYKTPLILNVSLEDRISYIRTLQHVLKRKSIAPESTPVAETRVAAVQQLAEQLVGECYKLISRQRHGILVPLKRKKVSYPEGIIFNEKTFEKQLFKLYNALELFHTAQDVSALLTPAILETLEYIQNSLDRTYLAKEGIDRAFAWTAQTVSTAKTSALHRPAAKTLIIKGIEKINHAVVGKFLKTLEDPIPHTRFILIAENLTELHTHVIAPLLSRCFKIPFLPLSSNLTQLILEQKLGIQVSTAENLETFFRHPTLTVKSVQHESKLALAIFQARKNSLSYIQYLAREHPEDVRTLLKDLKTGLAYYLETYFIKISLKPLSQNERQVSPPHRKTAFAIKQIPLSLKKSLAFRALIQKCERLKSLGVVSNETIINRLALFIRKIY